MLTGVTSTTNTSTSTSASSKGSTTSTVDAAQDRFLKLLVAQLNNQDPMNPVEEMVNMISASRSYQNNVEVMNTAKSLLLKTLQLGQ